MKVLLIILGVLAFAASAIMFYLRNDSHLSELGDFWWMPLPLGGIAIALAMRKKE